MKFRTKPVFSLTRPQRLFYTFALAKQTIFGGEMAEWLKALVC